MKKFAAPMLAALLLFTTACNGAAPAPSTPAPPPSASAPAAAQTYTGLLEQINDGMILVTAADDDSKVYTFDTEGITVGVPLGGKVTVTYTGNLDDADSLLVASKVEAAG